MNIQAKVIPMKELQPVIETKAAQTGGQSPFTLHSVGNDQTSYKGNQKHFIFTPTNKTSEVS